ncbi:MAG: hypothetical protein RLZZ200_1555 [Pseudomonadota bacterium]|jgi:hypothetical protein
MRAGLKLNRRQFVAGTAAAAAGTALEASPLPLDLLPDLRVCDRRCAAQLRPDERLGDIAWYQGDVTALWNSRLKPLWQAGGARIAGVSRAPALFCLEQLARRQRHVVVQRQPIPGTDAVRWVIAPVSSKGWI